MLDFYLKQLYTISLKLLSLIWGIDREIDEDHEIWNVTLSYHLTNVATLKLLVFMAQITKPLHIEYD